MATSPIPTVIRTLTAGQDELLYTVGTGESAVVTVNLACTANDADVRLTYATGADASTGASLFFDYPLKAKGKPARVERDLLTAGVKVYARASAAGVQAVLTGLKGN